MLIQSGVSISVAIQVELWLFDVDVHSGNYIPAKSISLEPNAAHFILMVFI